MLRVGLTGGIGSGKSTVGRMLAALGCHVIDSDLITRTLFLPGDPVNLAVAAAFGPRVTAPDGSIDRKVLGEIVFKDPAARATLNGLVHPAIKQRQAEFLADAASKDPDGIGVVEAALIIEAGNHKNYDRMIVVTCPPDVQRARLRGRTGLSDEEIAARIASQMPMEEKAKYAHFVIDNSGGIESTEAQVLRLWQQLKAGG